MDITQIIKQKNKKMSRLSYNKSVLRNLAKSQDKTELTSEKIELNKISDLKKNFNEIVKISEKSQAIKIKLEQDFQATQKELTKLQDKSESLIKSLRREVMDIDTIFKDLGQKMPNEISDMFDETSLYSVDKSNLGNIYG